MMKQPAASPNVVVDEMFPERMDGSFSHVLDIDDAAGSSNLMSDMNPEKSVHSDFFNKFDDLFDDNDLE